MNGFQNNSPENLDGQGGDKNKRKTLYIVLTVLFALIFVVSSVLAWLYLRPADNEISNQYKRDVDITEELPDNPIDFDSLWATNPEVVGWITLPSTEDPTGDNNEKKVIIDYPVLQSSIETEENFYIDHDIDRNKKREGSIYIQRDNSAEFDDFNTVIYGHNMLNKSMFGTLKRFRNAEYFKANRTVTVYTPGHIKEYEIVSAFIYDDRLILSAFTYFMDDESKQSFIDTCKNPNTLVKNVTENFDVTVNDRLITLSTCTSAENERYLVVAKLVKDIKTK